MRSCVSEIVVALVVPFLININAIFIIIVLVDLLVFALGVLARLQTSFSIELAVDLGSKASLCRAHLIELLLISFIGIFFKDLLLLLL